MSNGMPKAREIKRLTTPLAFKNSKAYDSDGNRVNCVETMSEIKYIIEPKEGILSDDEVLQYAPESRYASRIKLQRGSGSISDILGINDSIIGIFGVYYMFIICLAVPFSYWGNTMVLFILLILSVLPFVYLYMKVHFKKSAKIESKPIKTTPISTKSNVQDNGGIESLKKYGGIESLKKYEKEVKDLKILYDVKEGVVRDLIEKRFAPPQITYDKFMSVIDSCHKLFYSQHDAALNIINLAAEDTPRIDDEVERKISNMKAIIDQIESLTNELVINISEDDGTSEEVKNLLEEMQNLVGSVKEY